MTNKTVKLETIPKFHVLMSGSLVKPCGVSDIAFTHMVSV